MTQRDGRVSRQPSPPPAADGPSERASLRVGPVPGAAVEPLMGQTLRRREPRACRRALHPRRTGWLDGTTWPPGRWWPWTQRCGSREGGFAALPGARSCGPGSRPSPCALCSTGTLAGDALHPRTWQPEQDERRWPLLHTPSWTWRVDGPAWSQREAWPEDGSAPGRTSRRAHMRQCGCDPGLHACIGGRGGRQPRPQTMPRHRRREPHRWRASRMCMLCRRGTSGRLGSRPKRNCGTTRWIGGSEPLPV